MCKLYEQNSYKLILLLKRILTSTIKHRNVKVKHLDHGISIKWEICNKIAVRISKYW